MTARFGQRAARLCGQAALLLGWRPAEFWAATPEELAVVLAAFAPASGDSLDRGSLKTLMERDPDG